MSPSLGVIDTVYTESRGYALLLVFNVVKFSFWTVLSQSDYLRTNLTNQASDLAGQRKDASASPGLGENGGARVDFDGNETLRWICGVRGRMVGLGCYGGPLLQSQRGESKANPAAAIHSCFPESCNLIQFNSLNNLESLLPTEHHRVALPLEGGNCEN